MRASYKWLLVFCIAAAFVIFFLFLFFRNRENPNELTLYGNVDVRQVELGFRVAGRVEKLFFEEGDFVPEGALVALLDQSPYDAELKQAEAHLKSIQVNVENAEILLERRKQLIGVGGVSQEDLDNALARRDELYADFLSAKASFQKAQDSLSYTELFAPTDGVILSRIREPGTAVNPTDAVYTLSVISPVWIRAYVNEPDLGLIYYGMPAEVTTDSQNRYSGKIGFISPMAEFTPKTVETTKLRTDLVYRLRVYVDNPDRFLKQGMPVTVQLKIK